MCARYALLVCLFCASAAAQEPGAPLFLSNGQPAFVEVAGPGGADPCGPAAGSTFGCDEVGGNAVYVLDATAGPDANSTGAYALRAEGDGTDTSIGAFAPSEFEIRFTERGSVAYRPFQGPGGTPLAHRVPFEVWDVGAVVPGEPNSPVDDVRMIPLLLADDAGNGTGRCDFAFGEIPASESPFGVAETDRIYAYYPATTYADFEADAAPLVDSAPDGCLTDAAAIGSGVDFNQLRPIQRVVIADLGAGSVEALGGAVIRFYTNTPEAVAAPALAAPADGAAFAPPENVTLTWNAATGAATYRVRLSIDPAFEGAPLHEAEVTGLSYAVPTEVLLEADSEPVYWGVVPVGSSSAGPASEARSFTYPFAFAPGALTLSDGQFAFVEVAGPGGADPCGPAAGSTFGCDEVGGNAVYVPDGTDTPNPNGTGAYALTTLGDGPEAAIGAFAPRDYEIRFTAEGSIGVHLFLDSEPDETHRVPFEVWDVGVVPPGTENDPSDDVRMIPALFSDGDGTCAFEFGEVPAADSPLGAPLSDRIYAYYPATSYADFDAAAAPLVDAAPDGCYDDDGTVLSLIDVARGRPIQRVVVADLAGSGDVAALEGAVIRFYTTDPEPVAGEAAPTASPLALTVAPNPSRGAARVSFALPEAGIARIRVVDVLGRQMAVLADGERAAGQHTVTLPRRLASGVYVVTVEAGDARASRTLTVVR